MPQHATLLWLVVHLAVFTWMDAAMTGAWVLGGHFHVSLNAWISICLLLTSWVMQGKHPNRNVQPCLHTSAQHFETSQTPDCGSFPVSQTVPEYCTSFNLPPAAADLPACLLACGCGMFGWNADSLQWKTPVFVGIKILEALTALHGVCFVLHPFLEVQPV